MNTAICEPEDHLAQFVQVRASRLIDTRSIRSVDPAAAIIQYRQGSPSLQGISDDSGTIIVSTHLGNNQLTVRTSHGDEVTYSPHLTKSMTVESKVYPK